MFTNYHKGKNMTVKRMNEIATRVNKIRIEYNVHDNMDELDKINYCDELIEYSDELIEVSTNSKYFWLSQSLLHDLQSLSSDLLK